MASHHAADARFSADADSRDRTHDRHKEIRDKAIAVLKEHGEPMRLPDLAKAVGVPTCFLGRTLGRFPRYFEIDRQDDRRGDRAALVQLHHHLLAGVA